MFELKKVFKFASLLLLLIITIQLLPAQTPTPVPAWQVNTAYKIGDLVTYAGQTWKCVYAHTSNAAWYPGAPGLWFWVQQ
jgi:chitinase